MISRNEGVSKEKGVNIGEQERELKTEVGDRR